MNPTNPLRDYEEKKLGIFHLKTTLLAGAGQIVDGYDLTAAALVLSLVEASFTGYNLAEVSLILFLSITLGNLVGGLVFGYLVKHGRKRFYGIDATLMTLGALLQAFVQDPYQLAILRFLLGVGIGADYVLSPLINAEYANRKDRGKLLALSGGFMWNVGALVSVVVTLAVSQAVPQDMLWRIVLASGAIPAIAVIYGRRKFPETPQYLAFVKGDSKELEEKYNLYASNLSLGKVAIKAFLPTLIFASVTWYLFDVSAYSGVFFGPSVIAKDLGINGLLFELIILGGFAVPWNLVSAGLNDRLGRRALQAIGFAGMGTFTLLFAFLFGRTQALESLLLYGFSTVFSQLGPGTVVGFWGVELFPAEIRGITQGVTVMSGRLGVLTTTFLFPLIISSYGIVTTMMILAGLSFVAVFATLLLPEPNQVSLAERELQLRGLPNLEEK
ncbi:General substrate transporter [Metallosphaera sedula]|uniref:General substrate transporter n=3 Tax=Metallosphaera TaxID=41980 RepID=A4YF18_METS5|nr:MULTISPECIES: MFS transporter [Metallosphaera]ABP95020.1 General substrate transporter [Metallosphaera sedula DSM 5348]AIM27006.1 General substrate transporter [Metallosphaera sedula]AKV73925.1 MFS transporter [Metallosphaera sedula]AKV76167.1 MFS transporter [Metallosphaera sedula]AKV78418.1 MFS transporter [Metallosphaera sedula]